MKHIFTVVAALLAGVGIAMAASETIYLKNGSVIKGDIIEERPGQSLKIQTADGSIFVYNMDEVDYISKETQTEAQGHRGLDFGIGTGVDIMDGGSNVPIELILSKKFNKYVSVGIGTGVNIPTGGGDVSIPIFADFKGYLPLKSTKLTPFLDVRGGYVINTADDVTVKVGKYSSTVEAPNFVMASIMPGIRIPVSNRTDLDFGLGYVMYAPTGGGDISSAFGLRLGLNFHKSTGPAVYHEPVPTRNTGFEFGFDVNALTDLGLNLFVGYRLNKKLSVGIGGGASWPIQSENTEYNETVSFYHDTDAQGEPFRVDDNKHSTDLYMYRIFLRGEYRLTEKKFAPYVALDLGYHSGIADGDNTYEIFGHEFDEYKGGFFMRPQLGLSWRCTNNSYLQIYASYEFGGGGIKGYDEVYNSSGYYGGQYSSMRIKVDGKNYSNFAIGITWKRTFGLFSRD